ncbi:MAG: hypothetical protein ACR2NG_01055 [Acidimicrobiia bacterium]
MLDTQTTADNPRASAEPARRNWDWLLYGAAALVVIAVAVAVLSGSSDGDAGPSNVSGFEYNTDATSGRVAQAGVTAQYFGNTDQLYPDPPPVSGFEDNTEATSGRITDAAVTTPYFGYNPPFDEG